jgi:hypothetical protein
MTVIFIAMIAALYLGHPYVALILLLIFIFD